jgi:hypothetical protein
MADFTGATTYEALNLGQFTEGYLPTIKFTSLNFGAFRKYAFAPNANAGNRPTSSQIYPRGVR